jgi:Domain of unknown function (DUF5658)
VAATTGGCETGPVGGLEHRVEVTAARPSLTAGVCWTVGMVFALLDAVTTWYAVTRLHMPEGNPVARWVIAEIGVSEAVALRVLVSAVVLGLLAVGSWIPLPEHRSLVNRSCRVVLIGALVLWGVVAVSNTAQIAIAEFH